MGATKETGWKTQQQVRVPMWALSKKPSRYCPNSPLLSYINNLDNLPAEKVQELISIRCSITTIDELEKRGVLSETQAITETKYYLEKSQIIVGEKLSLEQMIQLTNNYEIVTPGSKTNIIQKIAGFVTFTNIILTAAAILLVFAVESLASLYLIPILTLIPGWGD